MPLTDVPQKCSDPPAFYQMCEKRGECSVCASFLETTLPSVFFQNDNLSFETVSEKIKEYVELQFFEEGPWELTCLTPFFTKKPKSGSKSGDLTFQASSQKRQLFIKAYTRSSHPEDCDREVLGMEILRNLPLSWAKALTPLYVRSEKDFSHIGLPFLERPNLTQIFQDLHPGDPWESFLDMCFHVGRALSELHHQTKCLVEPQALLNTSAFIQQRAETYLKLLPVEPQTALRKDLETAREAFLKNPGCHSYVHGDANLSNFLVQESGEVYMVDLERLCLKINAEGMPIGFPAEDYHRFLGWLSWLNADRTAPPSLILQAKDAFERGYGTYSNEITPEAHAYFATYWNIHNTGLSAK